MHDILGVSRQLVSITVSVAAPGEFLSTRILTGSELPSLDDEYLVSSNFLNIRKYHEHRVKSLLHYSTSTIRIKVNQPFND